MIFKYLIAGLLPGRALQTNLQQIDETHAIFPLENPASINHLCVFLLGTGTELFLFVY